ncbi:MAG: glutathione S-transferase family protein [Burkholderiales bacterium]|nr:MAG: glutathione S-transferase family protein [Burkholderiales bacterium]
MVLYIGNKNYSSWSMRPWLLMRQVGIAFEERKLRLFSEDFYRELAAVTPAHRVPVLCDGDLCIWDSLAIVEYLAERFPDHRLWPAPVAQRAHARAISAEMHSGFGALRAAMPMNIEASLPGRGWNLAVQADVDRIVRMWLDCRARHAGDGPFLFGAFSIADAMYAPVVWRFRTYAVSVPSECEAYMATMLELPAMRDWVRDALAEQDFLDGDEPYRRSRD